MDVVNAHAKLDMTRAWGNGATAAADGTHMDTYLDNLLAETSVFQAPGRGPSRSPFGRLERSARRPPGARQDQGRKFCCHSGDGLVSAASARAFAEGVLSEARLVSIQFWVRL